MDNYRDIFKKRLKETRKIKGLSQDDLAKRCGFSPSHISHFENGSRAPTFDNLIKLVIPLGTSIDYLIGIKTNQLISGTVWARNEDWAKIRELEANLLDKTPIGRKK